MANVPSLEPEDGNRLERPFASPALSTVRVRRLRDSEAAQKREAAAVGAFRQFSEEQIQQ